jgi:hypothetical protein
VAEVCVVGCQLVIWQVLLSVSAGVGVGVGVGVLQLARWWLLSA